MLGCQRHERDAQGSAPTIVVERSETVRSSAPTLSFAPVLERVAPSVVSVYSSKRVRARNLHPMLDGPTLRRFFGPEGEAISGHDEESLGSGVIVSTDGYILTNNHVVDGADEIRVSFVNGQEHPAKLVGVDPATDLAVLKLAARDVPAATLADSTQIRVGDLAFAIGNPFGVGQTVTMGIISGVERTGFGITDYEDFIQTDAAVNPGNSGGPLIDTEGRVIGINTAILSRSGGYQGIGFAVPINLARFTMEQLIKNGRVIRGYLGVFIEPANGDLARSARKSAANGAIIGGVAPRSPASNAGLKRGDIVLAVNGSKITTSPELRLAVAQLPPGSLARLQVLRGDKEMQVQVTVTEMPRRDLPPTG